MGRYLWRAVAIAILGAVGAFAASAVRAADCGESAEGQDLFYNYYVAPGAGGVPAQLYLCPRPTPPLVGHTWITYQPLMPHEFLYHHQRKYIYYHGGGSRTVTRIRYH
jgi:hypothetical protein